MIIPVLTYCGTLNLHHTNTQISKYRSIQKRANQITGKENRNIENFIYVDACITVRKSVEKLSCEYFNNYFIVNDHSKGTRYQNILICAKGEIRNS